MCALLRRGEGVRALRKKKGEPAARIQKGEFAEENSLGGRDGGLYHIIEKGLMDLKLDDGS